MNKIKPLSRNVKRTRDDVSYEPPTPTTSKAFKKDVELLHG